MPISSPPVTTPGSSAPTDGRFRLLRGKDPQKDQSYFLFALTQEQLAHAAFPVGDLNKADVREYAHARGLPVADKPDSQEICFVPDGDYARFVEQRLPDADRGGVITNAEGHVLGRHDGVHRYTVGQRKGLRLSSTTPLYVLEIKPDSRTVVVGDRESLETRAVRSAGGQLDRAACRPQARSRRGANPASPRAGRRRRDTDEAGGAKVAFEAPQRAVTPGQAAVFYDGDEVVGGGWIATPVTSCRFFAAGVA